MTTDRELLEAAAKAAGLMFDPTVKRKRGLWIVHEDAVCQSEQVLWNPLQSDGDALRLAVKLGISVHLDLGNRIVVAKPPAHYQVENEEIHYDESKFGGGCDPLDSTRFAIVRAAAEIGRNMK